MKERQGVLGLLRESRFVDLAPAEIYATLLDEGTYQCSIRTMYRILPEHGAVLERRNQLRHGVETCRRHPAYQRPELLAEAPNQAGLSHLSFAELGKEACEESLAQGSAIELAFHCLV